MSAWLLQRPSSINDRHERFLIRVERDQPETTPQPLLAMRFGTPSAARLFAMQFDGLFDEWRVVRR